MPKQRERWIAAHQAMGHHPHPAPTKENPEEWDCDGSVVALDETPVGFFVEVEGDPTTIRRVVALLELDPSESIPYSYAELYARRRKEDPALPPDMVFPDEVPSRS